MAKALTELPRSDLYERDFYSWALEQAALLRARRFAELDLENLAEEVEDLGRRLADELQSRYATLVMHLLKWEFQAQRRSHSWAGTIHRERNDIQDHLRENPGLKSRRAELFAKAYKRARANAAIETNLPLTVYPASCPYTLDQVMDDEFRPGPAEPQP